LVDPLPDWYITFISLPPGAAYGSATNVILGADALSASVGTEEMMTEISSVATEPWFGFVILALWALIPLGLGLLRFNRTDL